jgi:hypothetical protein
MKMDLDRKVSDSLSSVFHFGSLIFLSLFRYYAALQTVKTKYSLYCQSDDTFAAYANFNPAGFEFNAYGGRQEDFGGSFGNRPDRHDAWTGEGPRFPDYKPDDVSSAFFKYKPVAGGLGTNVDYSCAVSDKTTARKGLKCRSSKLQKDVGGKSLQSSPEWLFVFTVTCLF